jgi:hypothetical protein
VELVIVAAILKLLFDPRADHHLQLIGINGNVS